jgi:TetR/AcrR family transcriptional regulator
LTVQPFLGYVIDRSASSVDVAGAGEDVTVLNETELDVTDSEETSRRRRDPEATRAAILDAGEKLFVSRGPAETSTSEIARLAGVTKSLIHHHFGSKEELWTEVKRRHFEQYYQVQRDMLKNSQGSAELLRQSIVTYFRFLQHDPQSVRFMAWRVVEGDDPCLDQEDELFALGMQRIRESQEAGELRADLEPISIIKAFVAMTLHWFQTKTFLCQILGFDAADEQMDERYLDDILKIFFDGVRPR